MWLLNNKPRSHTLQSKFLKTTVLLQTFNSECYFIFFLPTRLLKISFDLLQTWFTFKQVEDGKILTKTKRRTFDSLHIIVMYSLDYPISYWYLILILFFKYFPSNTRKNKVIKVNQKFKSFTSYRNRWELWGWHKTLSSRTRNQS